MPEFGKDVEQINGTLIMHCGRSVSWYNHLRYGSTLSHVAEDVHIMLGQVSWETSSKEVCIQEIYWGLPSGTIARE